MEESIQYLFGPIPSRRLGRSLGVSPIPEQTCNYTCTYCQLGRTTHMTNKRQNFFPCSILWRNSGVIPKKSRILMW